MFLLSSKAELISCLFIGLSWIGDQTQVGEGPAHCTILKHQEAEHSKGNMHQKDNLQKRLQRPAWYE